MKRAVVTGPFRRQRGQALVEFALVVPLLVLIMIAIFDLGRAVYAYNTIANAARAGGRAAIVNQTVGTIQQTAAGQAATLGISPGSVNVTFKDPNDPTLTANCGAPYSIGCIAVIEVRYSYTAITPLIGNIVGPITMSSTTKMPIERVYP